MIVTNLLPVTLSNPRATVMTFATVHSQINQTVTEDLEMLWRQVVMEKSLVMPLQGFIWPLSTAIQVARLISKPEKKEHAEIFNMNPRQTRAIKL